MFVSHALVFCLPLFTMKSIQFGLMVGHHSSLNELLVHIEEFSDHYRLRINRTSTAPIHDVFQNVTPFNKTQNTTSSMQNRVFYIILHDSMNVCPVTESNL